MTLQQKTALEQLFLKNIFPNRREKSALAVGLGISYFDVQVLLLQVKCFDKNAWIQVYVQ